MMPNSRRIMWPVLVGLWALFQLGDGGRAPALAASPLSLADAVGTALAQNPGLASADARLQAAVHRVTQAASGAHPQVTAYEKLNYTNNPMWAFGTKLNQGSITQADFDPDELNEPDAIANFATVLEVAWPLYDSGRTHHGRRQANLTRNAMQLALERAREQVVARTIDAYAGWLLALENLKVVEQTLATAQVNLKMVNDRYAAGFFVKSDLLRAQVRIAQLAQQQAQASNQVYIARARLATIMGVREDDDFKPASKMAAPNDPGKALTQWVDQALKQRPDLQQAQLNHAIAAAEVEKARAARLPGVNLVGNYEINTEAWDDFADNYAVGAVVSLSLYSGQRISARQREALSLQEAAKAELKNRELAVGLEVRQAYFSVQSALLGARATQEAIVQARENQRIIEDRYANGLETIVTLLDAELALQRTLSDHLHRVHDYHAAMTQLMLAAGAIDDDPAVQRFVQ